MRITQLVALGGIAVLAGCNEARPSATGPISEGPSLTVYTASAAAPVILEAYNGSPYTIPSGINDLGAVTGESPAGTVVLWETGASAIPVSTTALLVAGGRGHDINSTGQIAGYRGLGAALLTPNGSGYVMTDVGLPGAFLSAATGLNDKGQVVGYSRIAVLDGWVTKCFVWTPTVDNATTGTAVEFPGLGGTFCAANDINAAGQITGSSHTAAGLTHAFVRSGGVTIDLQPGTDLSAGHAINNAGQVVGSHWGHSAIWSPSGAGWTTAVDLIVPALTGQTGVVSSMAIDINDAGFVVGTTHDDNSLTRAFFWQGSTFTELTDPSSPIVAPSALTNVVGNVVVVVGLNLEAVGTNRQGLRWAVSLQPLVSGGCLAQLTQLINDMKNDGFLKAGEAVSLHAKVDAATRQAAKGNVTPAKNVLYALINEAEALRASGRLTPSQAQSLIDAALCAIAEL
jgi:probable HAF family extracellular repeat protein